MATSGLIVEAHNFEELQRALSQAPSLTGAFVKREFQLTARRVRRRVIRERMNGAPGIDGGQFKKGKHVQGFVTGNDLASLKAVNKISRILRVHEEGGTIVAKDGGFLFLSRKNRVKGGGKIFARVKQVVIPARLGFRKIWEHEANALGPKVSNALQRAMRVALERNMKAIASAVGRLTK